MLQDGDLETLELASKVRELRGQLQHTRGSKSVSNKKATYVLVFNGRGAQKGETILYYAYDKHRVPTKQGRKAYRVTALTRAMLDSLNVDYSLIWPTRSEPQHATE